MILLIAIATVGAIGIGIGTATQSAQAFGRDFDDSNGQSIHDSIGDNHCHQVSGMPVC
jgi:hypothetical protein